MILLACLLKAKANIATEQTVYSIVKLMTEAFKFCNKRFDICLLAFFTKHLPNTFIIDLQQDVHIFIPTCLLYFSC